MERFKRLTGWIAAFVFAVAVIAVYKTFDNFDAIFSFIGTLMGILTPFILGFLIAFLLFVPCQKFEGLFSRSRKKIIAGHARGLSVLVVYLILLGAVTLLLSFVLPALFSSLSDFIKNLPGYLSSAEAYFTDFLENSAISQKLNLSEWISKLDFAKIIASINFGDISGYFSKVVGVTSGVISFFLSLVISVYMLLSKESLLRMLKKLCSLFIPDKQLGILSGYVQKSSKIFYGFFYSQIIDAAIVSVLLTVGFLIIGVPYAPLLGLLVGMFNLIPYFGAIIGGVLAVLITLLTDQLYVAILVAVFIIVIQQIDANLLQPRIVSNSIGLRPIYVLLAITVGGGFFGFWGIFLGVPVLAIIRMLIIDYCDYRDKRRQAAEAASGTDEV